MACQWFSGRLSDPVMSRDLMDESNDPNLVGHKGMWCRCANDLGGIVRSLRLNMIIIAGYELVVPRNGTGASLLVAT